MKPNLKFLAKVRDSGVYWRRTYRPGNGDNVSFVGGQKTAKAHAAAGLIKMPYSPDARVFRPAFATLTDEGAALLQQESS